jgi:hypothetical protein
VQIGKSKHTPFSTVAKDDLCDCPSFLALAEKRLIMQFQAAERILFPQSFLPSLFPKKPKSGTSAWPTQVADHLVPNQVLGFFEFFRERERGKFSVFKGLQKPSSAQIQEY